ncbi:unnamed protein product [Amoebophrya sp. A120]|nr:unnamed protein product [Amoebophrya sp. A120]|eukprot:GSA120T00020872001.1
MASPGTTTKFGKPSKAVASKVFVVASALLGGTIQRGLSSTLSSFPSRSHFVLAQEYDHNDRASSSSRSSPLFSWLDQQELEWQRHGDDDRPLIESLVPVGALHGTALFRDKIKKRQELVPGIKTRRSTTSTTTSELDVARKNLRTASTLEDEQRPEVDQHDNWMRMLTRTKNGRKVLAKLYARSKPGEHPDAVLEQHLDTVITELRDEEERARGGVSEKTTRTSSGATTSNRGDSVSAGGTTTSALQTKEQEPIQIVQNPALKLYVDNLDVLSKQAETADSQFRAAMSYGNMASAELDELGVDDKGNDLPYSKMVADVQQKLDQRRDKLEKELDRSSHLAEHVLSAGLKDTLAGRGTRMRKADEGLEERVTKNSDGTKTYHLTKEETVDLKNQIDEHTHVDPRRHKEANLKIDELLQNRLDDANDHLRSMQLYQQNKLFGPRKGLAELVDKETFPARSHYEALPVAPAVDAQKAVNLDEEGD